jgi:energy-coupling factor transport system permease protein
VTLTAVTRRVSVRVAPLHPVAWWAWAILLAAAAARTTNPILLALTLAVAGWVVMARRPASPWAGSFGAFVRIGVVVIVIRVVVEVLFGQRLPGEVLFTLPSVSLPGWLAGVSVGGPVTANQLVDAACKGLQLATILGCVGAANALVSPYRLLRCVPTGLYEVAVAVSVAVAFAPQVMASLQGVRDARRLRGRPVSGLAGVRGMAVPVLEGALDRSLALAASMDSRGFGRRTPRTSHRTMASVSTLCGLLGLAVGVYGILDAGAPAVLGLPLLALGTVLVVSGLVAASRGGRTRYRPDRWGLREWLTAATGVVALGTVAAVGRADPAALTMPLYPLGWPSVPVLAVLGLLVAALPSVIAPAPAPTP